MRWRRCRAGAVLAACLTTVAFAGAAPASADPQDQAAASALQRQMRAEVESVVSLAIQSGDAKPALDSYDRYVASVKTHDAALLASVSRAVLSSIAADRSSPARLLALERLARSGDTRARGTLGELAGGANTSMPQGTEADFALARLGDGPAVGRIIRRLEDETIRDKSGLVDALIDARARRASYALVALLGDENPFNRMAAARGLASLGSKADAAALGEALARETEGPVKPMLAVALTSVGSTAADARMAQFEASPVADVRLMAVEAHYNAKNPRWTALARQLLKTGTEGARLRAAELLGDGDEGARREILKAAASQNLPTREIGARLLEATGSRDFAVLAPMLKDASPVTRAYAAGALLSAVAAPAMPTGR
jgi:hypothetical protein